MKYWSHKPGQEEENCTCNRTLFAGNDEAKARGSRLRGKHSGSDAGGSLMDMPNKVLLKGQVSTVLSAALAGKASASDALSCRGIFDR